MMMMMMMTNRHHKVSVIRPTFESVE